MANFISGKWLKGSGSRFSSLNPADESLVWQGESSEPSDVDLAIQGAQNAFETWAKTDESFRINILNQFAKNLEIHKQQLAELISIENGKPLWESMTEVQSMIAKVALSIKSFHERAATVSKNLPAGQSVIRYKPHGVVAVFGPYNFPGHLANGHIVPALLAGNVVIYKPSELTPAVAELVVKIWHESGIPAGVISLLQGGAQTGAGIVRHPGIQGLFFTGSSRTGAFIHEAMAQRPECILALEMGGNNALVVESYDDLDAAVLAVVQSAFISSGQRCTCARRLILVENESTDEFLDALIKTVSQIKVGSYNEQPEPYMGPLISEKSAQSVVLAQSEMVAFGAVSLIESKLLKKGTGFVTPGLIDVTNANGIKDEEIFGPLLQLIRVKNISDAINEAKKTKYGLAAGIFTKDKKIYERFLNEIQAGIINWNTQLTGASSEAPFGGVGLSGNHRPSAYFAADYCSYSVASLENQSIMLPQQMPQGITMTRIKI